MRNSTTIDVFLASPSDVEPERQVVSATVSHWNASRGRRLNVNFDLLRWETHTVPSFGSYAQAAINQQIGSEFDLLIAIFWARIGSATPSFASGTVEEFERALTRLEAGEAVNIALYFKTSAVPMKDIDPEQIAGVRSFIKRVQDRGGLYREFSTEEELKNNINLLLDQMADGAEVKVLSSINDDVLRASKDDDTRLESSDNSAEDIGLIDAQERIEEAAGRLGEFLSEVSIAQQILNDRTNKASQELAELTAKGVTASGAKAITDRVSAAMDEVTSLYNSGQAKAAESLDHISTMIRSIALFYYDSDEMSPGRDKTLADIEELNGNIEGAVNSLREFQDSMKSVPSLTTRFNVSRRQLLSALESFISELVATHRVIADASQLLKG